MVDELPADVSFTARLAFGKKAIMLTYLYADIPPRQSAAIRWFEHAGLQATSQ